MDDRPRRALRARSSSAIAARPTAPEPTRATRSLPATPGNNSVAQPNFHWGDADTTDLMTFVNASSRSRPERRPSMRSAASAGVRASHGGFFRRALQDTNWPQIYPQGFLPLIEPDIVDWSATAGVRGTASGWFWDASAQYGYNSFDFNVSDSLNVSLGPTTHPARVLLGLAGVRPVPRPTSMCRARSMPGLSSPLNVALGAEFRRENYQIIAGEPNSYIDGGLAEPSRRPRGAGRAGVSRVSVRRTKSIPAATASRRTRTSKATSCRLLRLGARRALRALQRLRQHGRRQAHGAPRAAPAVRPARRGRAPASARRRWRSRTSRRSARTSLPVGGQLVPFEVGTFPVSSPRRACSAPRI